MWWTGRRLIFLPEYHALRSVGLRFSAASTGSRQSPPGRGSSVAKRVPSLQRRSSPSAPSKISCKPKPFKVSNNTLQKPLSILKASKKPLPPLLRVTCASFFLTCSLQGEFGKSAHVQISKARVKRNFRDSVRFSVSVTKRDLGQFAVIRNRARRRLKEACMEVLQQHSIPLYDYHFYVRLPVLAMPWTSLLQEVASAMLMMGTAKPTGIGSSSLSPLPTDAATKAKEGGSKHEIKGPGNSRRDRPIEEYVNSRRFLIPPMNIDMLPMNPKKIKARLDELMLSEHNNDGFGWIYPLHVAMAHALFLHGCESGTIHQMQHQISLVSLDMLSHELGNDAKHTTSLLNDSILGSLDLTKKRMHFKGILSRVPVSAHLKFVLKQLVWHNFTSHIPSISIVFRELYARHILNPDLELKPPVVGALPGLQVNTHVPLALQLQGLRGEASEKPQPPKEGAKEDEGGDCFLWMQELLNDISDVKGLDVYGESATQKACQKNNKTPNKT